MTASEAMSGTTSPLTFVVLVVIALALFLLGALLERRYGTFDDEGGE